MKKLSVAIVFDEKWSDLDCVSNLITSSVFIMSTVSYTRFGCAHLGCFIRGSATF